MDQQKIWEIWEFFRPKYGGNMGIFTIFSDFFGKNMGNMGILKRLSEVFHRQNVISKKNDRQNFSESCVQ